MKQYIKYFIFLMFMVFGGAPIVNAFPYCSYYIETSEEDYYDVSIYYLESGAGLDPYNITVKSNMFAEEILNFTYDQCIGISDGDTNYVGDICNYSVYLISSIDNIKSCPEKLYLNPIVKNDKYKFDFSDLSDSVDEEYVTLKFYEAIDKDDKTVKESPKVDYSGGIILPTTPTTPATQLTDFTFCQEGTLKVFEIIGIAIIIVKVLIPLLLIIFGTIDLSKAIVANDDKAISNSVNMLVKRTIAGIIIFFIPTILSFLLGLLNNISDINNTDFIKCTNCMLDINTCNPNP